MGNKPFVYTYKFLREAVKTRQDFGDLDVHAYNNMLAVFAEAEEVGFPASYIAGKLKEMGWIHLHIGEHGKVSEVDENA